ncbi:hypothetical protein Z043_116711 [Scleropages formosus]|uniref:Perilipin n=1 Tax=Scleropages formosus TaxID=113540 RepID=A0A0P7TUA5_SCLFO|nr:hypothetical protein Z043_116711 [Scleropages formosus]
MVALTGAMPLIGKLEPQIAMANDLACKGLDKIEKKLPILHQPSEQTKGAVQDSVEMTKAVVSGSVNTVMGSRVAQLVDTGVDTVLSTSENLVDQYLPLTEEELEKEAKMVKGFEAGGQKPSYYVRLGSLSEKLRKRAYQQAIDKVRDAKQRSQESISQLHHTVDLIEYARKNMDGANQKLQEKFHSWVEWTSGHTTGEQNETEHIESRTLAITHSLTHQLQTTCLTLVSNLQGLPQSIQSQALSVARSASEVYDNFSKASTFRDVSDGMLTRSKVQLTKMKDSLDGIMDYLVNNTPLNWLVPETMFADLASEPEESDAPVDRIAPSSVQL